MDEGRIAAATLHWLMDAGCTSLVDDSPASWLAQPPVAEPDGSSRVPAEHLPSAGQHAPAGGLSVGDAQAGNVPANRPVSRKPDSRLRHPEPPLQGPDLPDGASRQTAPAPRTPVPQRGEVRTSMAPASVSVSAAAEKAARLAAAANTLEELFAAIEAFDGCPVKATANRTVICDGNPESGVMLIGEAPGAEEDRQGKPFVGAAGQLLDRMLAAIGLDRQTAYITNVFFWRPPGNRTPTPQEVALCQPFVRRHVELVRPKAILALGAVSAKALFETETGITRLRGQWKELTFGTVTVPVLASFHPAYLLRQPAQKRLSWEDLLAFRDRIGSTR